MADLIQNVVLDNGTGVSRAGFSGEDTPRITFNTIFGRTRNEQPRNTPAGRDETDAVPVKSPNYKDRLFIGEDVKKNRDILNIECPMEHGIVKDWNAMEGIWKHILYNKLNLTPGENPVLMTEAILNPKENRDKIAEIMFESLTVPKLFVAIQPVLALYASGRTTGVVLDSGEGVSSSVCVEKGYALMNTVQRLNIAGGDLTTYLTKLLEQSNSNNRAISDRDTVQDLKEKFGYLAVDFDKESEKQYTEIMKCHTLPDGTEIIIGNEGFKCAEPLFRPSLLGADRGLHQLLFDSIKMVQGGNLKNYYSNVLLSGGSTMFSNFSERLQKEMATLVDDWNWKMIKPEDRKNQTWIGGSLLAKMSSFDQMWITKREYEEVGPSIVSKKCY